MSEKKSLEYRNQIKSYIDHLEKTGNRAIIFGADRGGWYIVKVLEHFGISDISFIDNAPNKHTGYLQYDVYSPENMAVKTKDIIVFLGLFSPQTAKSVKGSLASIGFKNIHHCLNAFLFIYFAEVIQRQCDPDKLADSINVLFRSYVYGNYTYGVIENKYFVAPYVTSVITQKCNLRCRDCSQFMPYYKNPVTFQPEIILHDIKQFAKAFDVVPKMSLQGAEPLLHPKLGEICEEIARIPNIVFINFVTNGTILPNDKTLKQFAKCGVDIHQSDYGKLSSKQKALTEALNRNNIYNDIHFIYQSKMWLKPTSFTRHNRSLEENRNIYQNCTKTSVCCQLMDGKLHRCTNSMHGSHQQRLPRFEKDFVILQKSKNKNDNLAKQIRSFITRKEPLSACDYCGDAGEEVPPAIQLPKTDKTR